MAKRVVVKFHKENLIFEPDSSNALNQLMLHMMGAFAQFERELIKERQREGGLQLLKLKEFGLVQNVN